MVSLLRVDNRLIHGQVVEAWLPALKIQRVVVADDAAAADPLLRAAMSLAIADGIEMVVSPIDCVDFSALEHDNRKTLLLVRDIDGAVQARARGLTVNEINLGNVHAGAGRRQISSSVFLSEQELVALTDMAQAGVEVEARAVPTEKKLSLEEIRERLRL